MDDELNPFAFVGSLLLHGMLLGVMLAVAWPVKQMLTNSAIGLWIWGKDAMRKNVETKIVD